MPARRPLALGIVAVVVAFLVAFGVAYVAGSDEAPAPPRATVTDGFAGTVGTSEVSPRTVGIPSVAAAAPVPDLKVPPRVTTRSPTPSPSTPDPSPSPSPTPPVVTVIEGQ